MVLMSEQYHRYVLLMCAVILCAGGYVHAQQEADGEQTIVGWPAVGAVVSGDAAADADTIHEDARAALDEANAVLRDEPGAVQHLVAAVRTMAEVVRDVRRQLRDAHNEVTRLEQENEDLTKRADAYRDKVKEIMEDPSYHLFLYKNQPKGEIAVSEDDPILGPFDAPITLVVFDDFQCPRCAKFSDTIRQIHEQLPTQVRIVFKHFPLHKECNRFYLKTMHPHACEAARAAEAANRVGGNEAFWEYEHLLFKNRHRLGHPGLWEELASQIGLDLEQFRQALKADDVMERVNRHIRQAVFLRAPDGKPLITGTPGVFLEGRRVTGWDLDGYLAKLIMTLHARATQGNNDT